MSPALIIFIKNPIKGRVKTRLARDIGDDEAFRIYCELCKLTREAVLDFRGIKYVFYSDEIISHDEWNPMHFNKKKQNGMDLGERMSNAFKELFEMHHRIIIIGSDCPYLQKSHLLQAIHELDNVDCVIGPALDGGYYLLGLKRMIPELFFNKSWSTHKVLNETLGSLQNLNLSAHLLERLEDIDGILDWERYQNSIEIDRKHH